MPNPCLNDGTCTVSYAELDIYTFVPMHRMVLIITLALVYLVMMESTVKLTLMTVQALHVKMKALVL